MDELTVSHDQAGPLTLEELIEPLNTPLRSAPLASGAMLTALDGQTFQVLRLLKVDPQVNVYEATADRDGRLVLIRESLTEVASARLRHEAEVLEGLPCPMFPRVLACFAQDGHVYLATEPLATETTLIDLLGREPLALPQVLSVLTQVAFALTHLHAHGWVHGGLRPASIALTKPVTILDLSYAIRIGEAPTTPFYHAGYSPPELLTGGTLDPRADVYAVGALLYHAVHGHPIAETGVEWQRGQPATPFAGVPQILHRCLGSSETRYPSMDALHHDLLRVARRCTPATHYAVAAATTIGLEPTRTTNQDAYAYLTGRMESEEGPHAWAVACVADGMGGMAAGEVASDAAARAVVREATSALAPRQPPAANEHVNMIKQWLHTANEQVCAALEAKGARGGTTLVCACLIDRRLAIAHIGDGRLYLLRDDKARLLTHDHSLAMALALQGELTMDEVRQHPDRSQVTRSLGDRQPLPDYLVDTLEPVLGTPTMELQAGDMLLLCSDGLWEPVLEAEMLAAVHQHADLRAAANALLAIALQRGAPDNATVVLLRVDEVASS